MLALDNYNVALYVRLSKEDYKSKTSESVENQKLLLLKYIRENNYNLYDYYIDDGYTGTNFNRPDFKRMLDDIILKKVNMVVVKDLSRLGRDYITVGYYIEKWFPNNGVRFISLLDNVDTFTQNGDNDMAPFRSIFNDLYSKENSKKIRAALRIKQLDGKWVGGCPPFGYMKDINNRNKLIINHDEATIVKKIFTLFLSGNSLNNISNYLYNCRISPPSIIRQIDKHNKYSLLGFWSTTSIKYILKNQLYTGDMVQNRRKRISYKIRKIINNREDEWIIIPNTHEPIISKQVFNDVQRILKRNNNLKSKRIERFLLEGMLFCGDCNKRIVLQKNGKNYYTVCNNYKKYSKLKLCSSHSNNYFQLENRILSEIRKILEKVDINKIYYELNNKINKELGKIDIDNKIIEYNDLLDKCYIEKIENKISDDMYERITDKIKIKINKLQKYDESLLAIDFDYIKNIINNLNREMIIRLIEKIDIYENKNIIVHYNFFNHNFIA